MSFHPIDVSTSDTIKQFNELKRNDKKKIYVKCQSMKFLSARAKFVESAESNDGVQIYEL